MVVIKAYRMMTADLAAEVLESYPEATVDEAKAAEWEGNWAREWDRRFS